MQPIRVISSPALGGASGSVTVLKGLATPAGAAAKITPTASVVTTPSAGNNRVQIAAKGNLLTGELCLTRTPAWKFECPKLFFAS